MPTKSQLLRQDKILSSLVETRQNILEEISTLSKEERNQVFLGIWSVEDLLAHIVGWDYTNLEAIKSVRAGQIPAFYEHHDRDWRTYNAILVKKYKKNSSQELLTRVKVEHETLIRFLQTIPPEHFNKDFGVRFRGYKVTLQRLLEGETKDEQTHLQQILDFFKLPEPG